MVLAPLFLFLWIPLCLGPLVFFFFLFYTSIFLQDMKVWGGVRLHRPKYLSRPTLLWILSNYVVLI
jgi:hypothetical protein